MDVRGYRSFATELTKIALVNADVRALRAERRGEEYLRGGQLPTESTIMQPAMPKVAARKVAPPVILDKLQNPKVVDDTPYQNARDTALTGLGGALTGSGVIKLQEAIRGNGYKASGKQHAVAATLGTVAALADRMYRHRNENQPAMAKTAMIGAVGFTPGRSLHQASEVRKLHDTDVHTTAKEHVSGLVGNKFRIPSSSGT